MKPALAWAFKGSMNIFIGGLIFWVPSVLVHWIRGTRFSGFDILGLSILLPTTTCLFFASHWWPWRKPGGRLSQGLFALLGIWLLGPLMLLISATFSGGGFSKPDGWQTFLLMTRSFPAFTFMMSTYDGTLGALLLTTVLLPIFAGFRFKQTARP
jgi:hypothetical protein